MTNLQTLYSEAVLEYETGHYEKAHDSFTELSTYLSSQPEIWKGLAACSQVKKSYPEALLAWSMASLLDEQDPVPHFHAAECFYAQGNVIEARKAIRVAIGLPCTEDFLSQMIRLKEVIDNG